MWEEGVSRFAYVREEEVLSLGMRGINQWVRWFADRGDFVPLSGDS